MARASQAKKPTPAARPRAPKPEAPLVEPTAPKVRAAAPDDDGLTWADETTARGRVISVMTTGASGTTTYEEVVKLGASEADVAAIRVRLKARTGI